MIVGEIPFIFTSVVATAVHPRELVTVTVYMPESMIGAVFLVGLAMADVKPLGPLHAYEVPPVAVRDILPPAQYGPELAAPADGGEPTVIVVDAGALHVPFETTTVYVPS